MNFRPESSCFAGLPQYLKMLAISLICVGMVGCASKFPFEKGYAMTFVAAGSAGNDNQAQPDDLEITWLGTSSFHIQLGDTSFLTDPFYSHNSLPRVALGTLKTDTRRVQAIFSQLEKPDSIFVGHSHYDHMMDIPTIVSSTGWSGIDIYGSQSARNVLDAYPFNHQWNFCETKSGGDWIETRNQNLEYMAFKADHAPQVDGILIFDGQNEPRSNPPTRACQYRVGDTYLYLFRLSKGDKTYTVLFTGAATGLPDGFVEKVGDLAPVDVAILTVPSWWKVKTYPRNIITATRPRHIVLSHFNDFFRDYDKRLLLNRAEFEGFLHEAQISSTYADLETIIVPDLGGRISIRAKPRTSP